MKINLDWKDLRDDGIFGVKRFSTMAGLFTYWVC